MKTKRTNQNPNDTKLLTNGSGSNDRTPSHDEVANCAYFLWEQRGRVGGHDLDDWLEAEVQLQSMRG